MEIFSSIYNLTIWESLWFSFDKGAKLDQFVCYTAGWRYQGSAISVCGRANNANTFFQSPSRRLIVRWANPNQWRFLLNDLVGFLFSTGLHLMARGLPWLLLWTAVVDRQKQLLALLASYTSAFNHFHPCPQRGGKHQICMFSVNHRYVLEDIETISGLGWFLAWSIGLKLRKVSRKNAITLGNSWILQNSIWERKGKVFLIQIHDLSFRHFFTKRRDNFEFWMKLMDATFLAGHSVGIAWLANWQIDFEGCTEHWAGGGGGGGGWRGGDSIRDQQLLEARSHTQPATCQLAFNSDIKQDSIKEQNKITNKYKTN